MVTGLKLVIYWISSNYHVMNINDTCIKGTEKANVVGQPDIV